MVSVTEDFVGRSTELEHLRRHARSESGGTGLLLLSAPGGGASELLRQTYDRLFHEQNEAIPFYFALNQTDTSKLEGYYDYGGAYLGKQFAATETS